MNVHGIVKLSTPIFCSSSTLGQSCEITVANQTCTLTFPSLPILEVDDGWGTALLPPEKVKPWKRGEKSLCWGYRVNYQSGESRVEKVLFSCDVNRNSKEELCHGIYKEFGKWLRLFRMYVSLLTKHNSWSVSGRSEYAQSLELYEDTEDTLMRINDKNPIEVSVHLDRAETALNYDQLVEACRLASLQLEPRLEYQMLLCAYEASGKKDYRKAIIESATALEICLTERIYQEFDNQGISFGDKLMKKYRMLGGLFDLIRMLEIGLPDKDYMELIQTPRNRVVHKANFPDARLANQVISEVEELLELFSPVIHVDDEQQG